MVILTIPESQLNRYSHFHTVKRGPLSLFFEHLQSRTKYLEQSKEIEQNGTDQKTLISGFKNFLIAFTKVLLLDD